MLKAKNKHKVLERQCQGVGGVAVEDQLLTPAATVSLRSYEAKSDGCGEWCREWLANLLTVNALYALTIKYQQFTIYHLDGFREWRVAKDDKEVKHECVYVGPRQEKLTQPIKGQPAPPSTALAKTIVLNVLGGARGGYRPTVHCRKQMADRGFDIFDMEYAIRNGECSGGGSYSDEHKNFKYTFRANIDGIDFDAVFALSAEHDLISEPTLILITGCWKTKSGKRGNRY